MISSLNMNEGKISNRTAISASDMISIATTAMNSSPLITSGRKVVKVNINPNNSSIVLTSVNGKSVLKSNQTPEANSASDSNAVSKSDQNIDSDLKSVLSVKENTGELCFKGESLQQLSTNSLPSYLPASPPNFTKTDRSSYEYHCCTDCGDTFAIKSSLNFHLERRSVLIKFPCDTCKKVQIFYNRCTLLSHIRTHTDKSETADIAKALVCPLPRIFMDGLQNEFVNAFDEELSSVGVGETPASDLLEFSLKEVDTSNSPLPERSKSIENNNVNKVKCLDCQEEFDNSEERAKHLTVDEKIPDVVNHQCNKCNMICPSKCFLKAHQRLHLQVSPYVCPECGESPSPIWQSFQLHVKFKCYHNSRNVGYKCPVCKRLSPSNTSLLKHMELHSEKFLKCDSCASAYMNVISFNTHIETYHAGYFVKPKFNMIYKCALCDIVFVNNEQMISHRSSHLKEQRCEYVFNCMQCGKPLETKAQLNDHIKSTHPKIYKTITENLLDSIVKDKVPEPTAVTTCQGKVECIMCNMILHSNQAYGVHLAKVHYFIGNSPCAYCFMKVGNRKEMILHGKKHLQKGSYLCLLCNNKRWNDERHLNSHLIKHVNKLQFSTYCPICEEFLKTSTEALCHLRGEHMLFEEMGATPKFQNTKKDKEIVTCHFCRETFDNENELQDHLETKHHVDSLKHSNSALNENNVPSEPVEKKLRIEGNVCAKCNYHSTEREEFKKHILSHKTNKLTLQCQECGICFVVEPTLAKHLRIVHKISNPKKYMEDEGTNYIPDDESQATVSSSNSSLCSVCFTTFPNESSLKTHMRSHGMAFIQSAKSSTNLS